MSREPLVFANWKMHGSPDRLAQWLAHAEGAKLEGVTCAIFPPFPFLAQCQRQSPVPWGGQDVGMEDEGAFTGEVSAGMLRAFGCRFALVGHSERRQAGDTDEKIARRLSAAVRAGLVAVLCVGESRAQRERGEEKTAVERQLRAGLGQIKNPDSGKVAVAYEPVWAIGAGKAATPDDAGQMHAHIRGVWRELGGDGELRVLYGGSVKPENAAAFAARPEVNGLLVGGASLSAESFFEICRAFA